MSGNVFFLGQINLYLAVTHPVGEELGKSGSTRGAMSERTTERSHHEYRSSYSETTVLNLFVDTYFLTASASRTSHVQLWPILLHVGSNYL
jgi:hypothetical protein